MDVLCFLRGAGGELLLLRVDYGGAGGAAGFFVLIDRLTPRRCWKPKGGCRATQVQRKNTGKNADKT